MNECNSIETLTNTYSNLNVIPSCDQTKFRLNEINKIEDCFNSKIQQRKVLSKTLNKYIAAFDYTEEILICNKSNIYYLFYKCYWSSCSNSKCIF